ncbi:endolytic peptidoglycan transglycosylase RlpA [Mangrovibacter plantisponsor]|uniref:Endolytic peptidoglycan transglycosylase RlpA n=1 Tax=Mangrovibacter plantisponsor TaxID=451513 RepID=A0A317PZU7_9ENTR|nr:endolytic peptidoglycan transglycosylase RlpA [Mangrovibacter plantisponsor]PWW08027.1 rare lipoprotein A [Mangrovibacter plantisponsor]
MRKQWPGVCVAALLLAACSGEQQQAGVEQVPATPVCNGPTVEVSGAEPHYETPSATANQNYQRDGRTFTIVQDPSRFSQSGLAAIYDAEPNSNLTASGEVFDPTQLTAAHPTLPIPSYARITNLANGRMLIVKINDRGPYDDGRVVAVSRAAADRLNMSNNTRVRIDPILVAQDGTMSGPGMACITVAKQTYALPARPDLNSGLGSASSAVPAAQPQNGDVQAISNSTLQPQNTSTPAQSGGFLAPAASQATTDTGVTSGSAATAAGAAATSQMVTPPDQTPAASTSATTEQPAPAPVNPALGLHSDPVTAPGSIQGSVAGRSATVASGGYVVQVGAVSDAGRAQQWQQKLSQQFSVPGLVTQNGAIWRVQLGPFSSRSQAISLQQRLLNEAQQQSFITAAPAQ